MSKQHKISGCILLLLLLVLVGCGKEEERPRIHLAKGEIEESGQLLIRLMKPEEVTRVSKHITDPSILEDTTPLQLIILNKLDRIGAFKTYPIDDIVCENSITPGRQVTILYGWSLYLSTTGCSTIFWESDYTTRRRDSCTMGQISFVIDDSITQPYMYLQYDIGSFEEAIDIERCRAENRGKNKFYFDISAEHIIKSACGRVLVVTTEQFNRITSIVGLPGS